MHILLCTAYNGHDVKLMQVDVSGHGHHMGMDVVWQLKLRPDGAFLETISGKELKFRWGCSGGASVSSWEVCATRNRPFCTNFCGRCQSLIRH